MMDSVRANAYSEVLEILKYVEEDDYKKIPQDYISILNDFSNKENKFEFNPEKSLDEQNVSQKARVIIAMFFRDYWATENQRNKIIEFQKAERLRIEEEKRKKYNNIFDNKLEKNEIKNNTALVEIKENSFLEKIKNFINKLLQK